MTPSEWAITKIDELSGHYPIFWVEDPYSLIEDPEMQILLKKLSQRGRILIAASNPFRLYELLEANDPSSGHFVVIDQSCTPRQTHLLPKDCKPSDFKPIIAPHWKSMMKSDAFFRPTIREFLKFCTDDPRWPIEVDLFPYETLARKDPLRLVEAYETFIRSGRPLISDDLVMIGASAVFGKDLLDLNNPLVALEIAFHSQNKWDELEEYFNEGEVLAIRNRLMNLPFPLGVLFSPEAETARLAIVALIVLRQHTPEPGKLLPQISNTFSPFLDCNVGLYTEAPPWFPEKEVPNFEKLIDDKFKKYLYGQLALNDPQNADAFYHAEHFSRKLKDLVAFVQPKSPIRFPEVHETRVPLEQDAFSPSYLVPRFLSAKQILMDIYKTTKPLADKLRLTAPKDQQFRSIKEIFVNKKMHLIDRLVGEIHALKTDIDGPAKIEWGDIPGFEERWKVEANSADDLMDKAVRLMDDMDYLFGKLLESRYSELVPSQALGTDLFYQEFIGPRRRTAAGGLQKATILLIDSLRFDVWSQIIRPMLERNYEIEESFGLSRLPSETRTSRRAFFAGKRPGIIPPQAEDILFINHLGEIHQKKFNFNPAPHRDGMAFAVKTTDDSTYMGVFDFTDRLSHEISWSPHKIQESIRPILHEMEAVLREQGKDHLVFLTSDHGHIRIQKGIPVFIQSNDVGYRSAYVETKIEGKDAPHLFQISANILGFNLPGWYIFPKPGFYLRPDGAGRGRPEEKYRHGGISLFEMVVPLAYMKHRSITVKVNIRAEIKGRVEVGKTGEIAVSISTDGLISSPVKISADTNDVQPVFISDISSIPRMTQLNYNPSSPGKHTIIFKAVLGDNEVGSSICQVHVESPPAPVDPAVQKLKKIFGEL